MIEGKYIQIIADHQKFDARYDQFSKLEDKEMEELTLFFEKPIIELEHAKKFLVSLLNFPIYMHLEVFDFDLESIESLFISHDGKYVIQKLKSDTYHFEAKGECPELFLEMLEYMTAYAGYGRLNFYTNCNTCFNSEIVNKEIQFNLLNSSNFVLVMIKYDGNVLSKVSGKVNWKKLKNNSNSYIMMNSLYLLAQHNI